nr:flagellar export chaperone FliS [uncultured Campylobacter sp.]
MQSSAYNSYNSTSLSVDNQEKLVLMLYEGILRFAARAKKAMQEKNVQEKVMFINKISAIFIELSSSLDLNQGQIAHYLKGLYAREITRLIEANIKNDVDAIDEVIRVTRGLISAWNDATGTNTEGAADVDR